MKVCDIGLGACRGSPTQTAGPADEIWDLGATENLEVLNIDRVSVFRLVRFARGQNRRWPCGKGAPPSGWGFEIQAAVVKHSIRFAPKNSAWWIPRMGLRFPMDPR